MSTPSSVHYSQLNMLGTNPHHEGPIPIYSSSLPQSHVLDETPIPLDHGITPQQEATTPVDLSRDMDEIYDLHFNLKDPRFVRQFDGHLSVPPPISPWLSEAFSIAMRNIFSYAIWVAIYFVLSFTLGMLEYTRSAVGGTAFLNFLAVVSPIVITSLISVWRLVGIVFTLSILKANSTETLDASSQLKQFFQVVVSVVVNFQLIFHYIILYFVYLLAVVIGLFCFIIPGLWVAISFMLGGVIFVEHREDLPSAISDSLRLSKNIVNKFFWHWFLFLFIAGIMSSFIFLLPLSLLCYGIALRETIGFRQAS